MKESDVQTKFNHWVKARWPLGRSAAFELKIIKGENYSLPFRAVQDHQVAGLLAAKTAKLVYKIPDVGMMKKPFDSLVMSQTEAYVVAIYYVERRYCEAYLIDVDVWCNECVTSSQASLTKDRASEIATLLVVL